MLTKNTPLHTTEQPTDEKHLKVFLSVMPNKVKNSLDCQQLVNLKDTLSPADWLQHSSELKKEISLYHYQFYLAFIARRDYREMSSREIKLKTFALILLMSVFVVCFSLIGCLAIYLIKSAMGIDIFSNFSLGIWGWFQVTFLV